MLSKDTKRSALCVVYVCTGYVCVCGGESYDISRVSTCSFFNSLVPFGVTQCISFIKEFNIMSVI